MLLVCVPPVDLVLLVATILHLRSGVTADFTHGLAAAYIGASVVAFRPQHDQFRKALLAWVVSCVLLFGGVVLVATRRERPRCWPGSGG